MAAAEASMAATKTMKSNIGNNNVAVKKRNGISENET